MPIPDFQTLMLPLLQFAKDGQTHTLSDARIYLAKYFSLGKEELAEVLPSGKQRRFDNRVAWARVYLDRAGLLISPKRGSFYITEDGLQFLSKNPKTISISVLDSFPKFRSFRETSKNNDNSIGNTALSPESLPETPEELLEKSFKQIQDELAASLLDRLKNCSSAFFEDLVVELLVKMGYGRYRKEAGTSIGKTGDEGIDGIINEDRLGLEVIYIQAKCWKNSTVGRPEIQKFVGALHGKRAKKGVFITTSAFSDESKAYISHIDPRVVLIDGWQLAKLMIENNLGVSVKTVMELKRIDTDFFLEE